MGQILLLAAAFLVLVGDQRDSVMLVNKAREDARWWFIPSRWKTKLLHVLLRDASRRKRARGYLLTLRPEFLTDYEPAVAELPAGF